MHMRIAGPAEAGAVQKFYWKLIEEMEDRPCKPGWQKGVYPSDAFLLHSVRSGELYVLEEKDQIIGAMVLSSDFNEDYDPDCWECEASGKELLVIHALGVLPSFQKTGAGDRMVRSAVRIAREKSCKAIRLDVLRDNLPAIRLYEKNGFSFRKKVLLFYEDTGWTDFLLYEKVLL